VQKRYYVTTPIYYVNGLPHIGSAYTTTLCDSLARFYKSAGYETFFLTGTDEHGDKIQQAATKQNRTPLEFATEIAGIFRSTWDEFGLDYSRFIRTTEDGHKTFVSEILQRIYDKGDIYFGEYGGNYCYGCERFLTDKELVEGKCPDHLTEPTYLKESNYFFRMSKYTEALKHHLTEVKPDFIRPERYKNEILAMLREPVEDLCISRPKSRLEWGIELPFDKNFVTYVWFDALLNYVSALDYPGENYQKFWPVAQHVIGKDILKPHGLFWPTMLLAADIPLYQHLNVHGYWITPAGKMSKSLGNVIDPREVRDRYSMDVFRYFVLREMVFGLDGVFSWDALQSRYNSDLANNLGNLVSRTLAMTVKYFEGVVPAPGETGEFEATLREQIDSTLPEVIKLVESMEIHRAIERIWNLIDAGNVYIDRTKPWALAKDPALRNQLQCSVFYQLETIRVAALLIEPFLPDTARKILDALGESSSPGFSAASFDKSRLVGRKVSQIEALFPRKDPAKESEGKETAKMNTAPVEKQPETPAKPEGVITYDDFAKVKLRVGQIMQAERVEKSEKLLKLSVDIGEDKERQILAGIAKYYSPEVLVGRKIAVVANLKPAKLMGILSEGMLLAASDADDNLSLMFVDPLIRVGGEIR
jgi:methionyl-tRNA synthetase